MSADVTAIREINIDLIDPHPNNPRKNLGDLTEIAASIKANGIFQNLTIVPRPDVEGRYYAVIGHRRCAAAKIAGLQFLPCVISDMDEKQQVETMMMENMQRNDLTIIEQAEGFQMMLDLGNTVPDITTKTGFSESTIRRRVKLLELDRKKLKGAVDQGATLMDLAELEKIKDVKVRNKLLSNFGTNNFEWLLNDAFEEQEWNVHKPNILKELSKFAEEAKESYPNGFQYVETYTRERNKVNVPKDAGKIEYCYYIERYMRGITLYRKQEDNPKTANEKAYEAEEKERKKRCNNLRALHKTAYQMREAFVLSYTGIKKHIGTLLEFAAKSMMSNYYCESDRMGAALGIDVGKYHSLKFSEIEEKFAKDPERGLFLLSWARMDSRDSHYYDYYGKYCENQKLDDVYASLAKFGYVMSDEEKAMCDGTHELYLRK